jgi:hypothetical protein
MDRCDSCGREISGDDAGDTNCLDGLCRACSDDTCPDCECSRDECVCDCTPEVAKERADLKAEVVRLRAERDAFHAYAAFLQAQSTMKKDFGAWTSEEAVEWVAKVASGTFHRLAWTRNNELTHDACIAAIAKRREA